MKKRQAVLLFVFFFVLGAAAFRLIDAKLLPTGLVKPAAEAAAYANKLAVLPPDPDAMRDAAVAGVLNALNDPYAQYFPPTDAEDFTKALTGEYVGIGAEVGVRDAWLTIVTPLEHSPALDAGLRANDRVKAIDGDTTFERPIQDCIDLLKGTPGTPVTLTIERGWDDDATPNETLEITLERKDIVSSAVRGVRREPGAGEWDYLLDPDAGIAYVRLTTVTPRAAEQLEEAFERIEAAAKAKGAQLRGLILDLRDNPGGDLRGAVDVGGLFLDNQTIVSVRGRDGADAKTYTASAGERLPGVPIVTLVDALSASAAEVLAGALEDNERAIVVGERTLGKGTVQSVIPLQTEPGAYVKFTTQHWYLPSGRLIHRVPDAETWGVDPTPGFALPETPSARTARLLARQPFEIIPAGPGEADRANAGEAGAPTEPARWDDPEWLADQLADPTLAGALRTLRAKLADGQWTKLAPDDAVTVASTDGPDLWPDDVPIEGGEVVVRSPAGQVLTTLRITSQDLERYLVAAGLEPILPVDGEDADADESDAGGS